MQSVTIGNNQTGQRLDKFLKKYLPEAGSSFLYKMLRKKNITLNGKKAEGKEMLSVGDNVCFFFSDETFAKFSGRPLTAAGTFSSAKQQNGTASSNRHRNTEYKKAYQNLRGISILYEDENVLIVNKPVGVLTQKAAPGDLSLNEWLIGYLLESKAITKEELHSFHPSVCNRLDRNTSGIVLCGKSLSGSQVLSRMIKDRSLGKFYHTICVGRLTRGELLEGYLVKDKANNKVSITSIQDKQQTRDEGSYIKTAYHPLESSRAYTLLEVELITGKTHQIRAHLASIKHPIIGDSKYGNAKINSLLQKDFSLKSQLLHAYRIEFPVDESLPATLQGKVITAPYPKLFEKLTRELFQKK